jgi:hypothetical protein
MAENYEKFKNISSGVQSIVFTIAIIIGGLWTAFTFSTLKTKNKAQAELTDLDLKNARTKDELAEKGAVVDISLDAKQEMMNDGKGFYISVLAKIKNAGVKNTLVDLSKAEPLKVYKLSFNADGTSYREDPILQGDYNLSSTVLRSGAAIQVPLFVKVQYKGLYVLEFSIQLDKNELRIDNEKRKENAEYVYWVGSTYVLVK